MNGAGEEFVDNYMYFILFFSFTGVSSCGRRAATAPQRVVKATVG
jgi:hypothetical protein